MSDVACPSELELDRAHSAKADPSLLDHLEACDACRALWDEMTSAIELARLMPVDVPSASHREAVRTAVLAGGAVRREPASRGTWKIPALGILAAAAVALLVATRPSPATPDARAVVPEFHVHRGVVHAHGDAHYALTTASPDEIVRLRDGTLDIDVDPLRPGERFRVVVGVDEIEVRGTAFEVVADDDRLRSVRVVHGRVELRHAGTQVAVLTAGHEWSAAASSANVPPQPIAPVQPPPPPVLPPPQPVVRPPRRAVTPARPAIVAELAPRTASAPRDPQELAFITGWDAMRRSEFRQAAAAFARTVALDPAGSLAEDGAFWYAVALARVPRVGEAISGFRTFLEEFPTGTRAGEARAMLGWLLVPTDTMEARHLFESAHHDSSTSVQASARKGLDALNAPSR